jgi:hypothetical protein
MEWQRGVHGWSTARACSLVALRGNEEANGPAVVGPGHRAPVIDTVWRILYPAVTIGDDLARPVDDIAFRSLADGLIADLAAVDAGAARVRVAPASGFAAVGSASCARTGHESRISAQEMAAREARRNGPPVELRIVSSMEASPEENAPARGANLFYRGLCHTLQRYRMPAPAAREANQHSHCTAASGAAADHRDNNVLL